MSFELPKGLEAYRDRKIWVCHPLIWNPKKHNNVGGYDKPPINPYTLGNAQTNREESRATFDQAVAQIGKAARITNKNGLVDCTVEGVGIALEGTGICGLDLDNVVDNDRKVMTPEANAIMKLINSYSEVSPSGTGIHIIFEGTLPEGMYKKVVDGRRDIFKTNRAEYQLFNSGYMTVSGEKIGDYSVGERSAEIAEVYKTYFEPNFRTNEPTVSAASSSPSVVSCDDDYMRKWFRDLPSMTDEEVLEGIFKSPKLGDSVRRLYNGDMSDYNNDHSRADQALASCLYNFTLDRSRMIRLFKSSRLFDDFQSRKKSRGYLERTFSTAEQKYQPRAGHVEWTREEKRAFAQKKADEERRRRDDNKMFHF